MSTKPTFEELVREFETTCGWCGMKMSASAANVGGVTMFVGDVDDSRHAGQIFIFHLAEGHKTVTIRFTSRDLEYKVPGCDMLFMACSDECRAKTESALQESLDCYLGSGTIFSSNTETKKTQTGRRTKKA